MSHPDFRHAVWHKSSRSGGDGNCVEVAFTGWRTSTRSNGNGGCVQVAQAGTLVGVRDSKDPAGPVLAIGPAAWSALLTGIRHSNFRPS
ncbi:MAG TPA: DUF397 domain-containing protein [Pseudonocardiaceae bacterium]